MAFLGATVSPAWSAPAARVSRTPAAAANSGGKTAAKTSSSGVFTRGDWDGVALGSIDPQVFDLALSAASCAVRAGAAPASTTLTVIDYSKPSTAKRLWVYDLQTHALLYEELVAHGSGSGENLATAFSNEENTHRSSLGLFVTQGTYTGKNGYSLRLNGLDRGFNDRALDRAIVMHGAPYVDVAFARTLGRLGRSWGCPAVRPAIAHELIDRVKGGGLVFAYYPDQKWLAASQYLGSCGAAAH
jgi:hypothetical protein